MFRWLFDATVARDTRNWHRPDTDVEFDGKNERRSLTEGESKIDKVTSPELIDEFRKKGPKKA